MGRYLVDLGSRRALSEASCGGKGASLAWLTRNGFNVPSGFVITSEAFREFMAYHGIVVPAEIAPGCEDELERIRRRITSFEMPAPLARHILRAYRRLGAPAAIRSSMVGEDGRMRSFAGQLDTALGVHHETEVLEAVKRCWASAFSWRSARYLAESDGLNASDAQHSLSVAVVVQEMVASEAAGVAFTADPLTGQRCVVIEAARGLGDAVVAGRVQPDRCVVDARGLLAETTLVDDQAPVLTEGQVLHLAQIVRQVARKVGIPQDVEWAWDGSQFYMLQSRPITSLENQTVYSNKMVSDMAPGLITPLVYSTKIVAMAENVFGRVFTELLGANDTHFGSLVARIHSRVYTNVTLLGDLFERVGMPSNFFEAMSRGELADTRRPPLTLRTMAAVARLGTFALRHSRVAGRIEAFIPRHDEELERYRGVDWSSLSPESLLVSFDRLMRLHGELQWHIFIGPINMTVRNRLLGRLVDNHTQGVAASDLIRGLVGLKALEPNEELRRLAGQACALDDGAQHLLGGGDDPLIRKMLAASQNGRELSRGVDAFLDRYGFLSPNGTDFAAKPWSESPGLIWRAIGRYAASPPRPLVQHMAARRDAARKRVRSQLGPLRRLVFDRLLRSTVTYIDLRERTSLLMSEDSYHMRRIFVALADHLVARGDLDRRDDIFHLFYAEVQRLVDGSLDGDTASRLVVRRRAEMETDADLELPDTICGEVIPRLAITPPEGQDYLVGIAGSSGVAQGRARIIFDPCDVPMALTQDDILVVPFTDVGWTPLFPGIGGIVAETGGQLSHTSIIAREYGLPAVVSVKLATQRLTEGQAITVDGDAGRVYLKHLSV